MQQQQLGASAAVAPADQARRDDLGIVAHQQIAGLNEFDDIRKAPMFRRLPAAQHHQAAFVAPRRRMLRDQLRRQRKIELG
jgi:hypothetical protein